MSQPTPVAFSHDLLEALRTDLIGCPYTVEEVADVLGPVASAALHREQPTMARRVLRASTRPVATLVRFFTLGEPLSAADLDVALPTVSARGLAELALARETDNGLLRATCDLRPYGDETHTWWLASDLSEIATGAVLENDHVLGIGGASTTLASWTPRRQVQRALDLGTGCGVQAAHLSTHVSDIVATDLSTRALEFVSFNAVLNGWELDVRKGSMLEPVAGETFDLIVSNPPFVITPRRDEMPEYEYRDGGAVGDTIIENLVKTVGAHLNPGGVAQFLGNWEMRAEETLHDVWGRWLTDADVDVWVVQREEQDPAQYAELWARDGGAPVGSPEYDTMYEAWIDDFADRGVERIGFGVITVHKPREERAPFVDLMDERGGVASPMGPAIDAGLTARVWLATHTDDELLDTAWVAAPDVTEERHTKPGADDPSVIMIRQGGGLGLSIQADTVLAAFMSVADGSMSARVALVAIASLVGVEEARVIDGTLPLLRTLIANGLLIQA